MALLTKAPRGTQDILPAKIAPWQAMERELIATAQRFGFQEIRTPTFEHTELFNRSVGDTTDVVQKEMYTFQDKGDRSITLRPEGTAGAARAVIEHGLLAEALPVKVSYLLSCFRYEKPQAGRLREFHQFGAEMYGSASPAADADLIALASQALENIGIREVFLEINSIGCPHCRPVYLQALREYFGARQDHLCPTCRERLGKNPLRILDCKNPDCAAIAAGAPLVLDHLCGDCREHFDGLKARLDAMGIPYTVNPRIVRGLDYYTRTVFEFVSSGIGAQGTVCGGGRYDGLIQELGGPQTPALGFAMGLERLLLVLEAQGNPPAQGERCDLYVAPMGENASVRAFQLVNLLRAEGYYGETDLMGRSLRAQMKYADKLGCRFSLVLGDNELETGEARLKDMETGESLPIPLGEGFLEEFDRRMAARAYAQLEQSIQEELAGE